MAAHARRRRRAVRLLALLALGAGAGADGPPLDNDEATTEAADDHTGDAHACHFADEDGWVWMDEIEEDVRAWGGFGDACAHLKCDQSTGALWMIRKKERLRLERDAQSKGHVKTTRSYCMAGGRGGDRTALKSFLSRRRGCLANIPPTARGDAAAAARIVRGTARGDAAAATWIVCGGELRGGEARRRSAETSRGDAARCIFAATPRPRRG